MPTPLSLMYLATMNAVVVIYFLLPALSADPFFYLPEKRYVSAWLRIIDTFEGNKLNFRGQFAIALILKVNIAIVWVGKIK